MGRFFGSLIAFLCLLCVSASAQSVDGDYVARNQVFELDKFDKGQYSNVNPHTIPADGAVIAQNVRANINVGSLNKRPTMLLYGTMSAKAYPVKSVYKYYLSNGNKNLIATIDDAIYSGNDTTGAFTLVRDGLTSGKRFTFVTYKDILIMSNGFDNIQKWDGSCANVTDVAGARSDGQCTTDLGAPFASQGTGSNLDATSWYQYKIAYFDGTNYQYSSARSNPIKTGSTLKGMSLTNIPLGPTGTTQRLIYRTVGDASKAAVIADNSFYLLTTISDNSTTTFTDNVTDATILADASPKWSTVSGGINATPPKGKYLMINKERLWVANDPSVAYGRSYVYFTPAAYYQDYFLASNYYFNVRPDDGDEITFLKTFLGAVTVGKTNTISKIYTDSAYGSAITDTTKWILSPVISFIGCAAPYSAVETPFGILYLSSSGVYAFDGQNSKLYSDRVTDVMRDVNQVNLSDVVAAFYNNEFHMAYTSKSSGSAVNDRVLIFDSVRDSFSIDTKKIDSMVVSKAGSDYGAMMLGSSASDGKVYLAQQTPASLEYKTKSGMQAGTTDSVDVLGDEDNAWLQLGWGKTWSQMTGTWASQTGTWAIANQTGYWYSPVVAVNAASFSKLYWNQVLNAGGSVSFSMKSGATSAACAAASWTGTYTNPSGSDVSGITGNVYVQLRAKLVTTDTSTSPIINLSDNFNIKLVYSQVGSTGESSFLTFWESGWYNLYQAYDGYKKRLRSFDVHYTGTSGTLTIGLKNSEGSINTSFTIDLSQIGSGQPKDPYTNQGLEKIYHWEPPMNSLENPTPIGEYWKISVTESGNTPWSINKIMIVGDALPRNEP